MNSCQLVVQNGRMLVNSNATGPFTGTLFLPRPCVASACRVYANGNYLK